MKTIRWLIYREALAAVGFVTLGFLALFFFFDMVDELRYVGRVQGYQMSHALLYVSLGIPSHLYELLPITVLIGTIFVMARFAQSSEFTIMRTSGLGPWSALRTLLVLGLGFVMLTFTVGDYLAPATDRLAQLVRARYLGQITTGATGAWLKERQGDRSVAVNVRALRHDGGMSNVRIFEFDGDGRLASTVQAAAGEFGADAWELRDVKRSVFHRRGEAEAHVERSCRRPASAGPRTSARTWWRHRCSSPTAWRRSTCSSTSATWSPTDRRRRSTRSSSGARCSIP